MCGTYSPKVPKFSGARKGRTGCTGVSSALHFTFVVGQASRLQGGHAGHTVGSGHFTSGQRGLGQGGQSPQFAFLHEELSTMMGSGVGIELFNTYCERSGTGGHSVLSIYWLISGQIVFGGTEDLRTYFVISGMGGHESFPHTLHTWVFASWKPSF